MVVLNNFREIFDASCKQTRISLPTLKDNYLKIVYGNCDNEQETSNGPELPLPFADSGVINARLCKWRRLTAEHPDYKPVYEVTLDIKGSNLIFRPGDTIGIIPQNIDTEVANIIDHLELAEVADCTYCLTINSDQKGAKIPLHVPVKSTLRYVLTHCVDIRGIVKKLFLLALANYTEDDHEKQVLEYLCSKEGSAVYNNYILNQKLCILDIFQIFKSCKPPVEVILQHLPRLLPRPYSIINSGLKNPNELKICFSVINIGNNRKGLVTGWLESIINENGLENMMKNITIVDKKENKLLGNIPIYLRKNINQFSFPEEISRSMILIGPGTGVAPYIGFLEERNDCNIKDKNIWLFFGCRHPNYDFIYKEELQNFIDGGALSKLSTAFSRYDNCDNKYVQDAILRDGDRVANVLKQGALVYVCGDVQGMAAQVKDCFVKCLIDFGNYTTEQAERFICDMQKEKRYLVDSWN
ncbi:methionine synthase reductase [Battus philenor]|uniref:methionine synthase reductase n=1 Tax=Battus philenor TaxID=42288 RepID=UPI0035CF4337